MVDYNTSHAPTDNYSSEDYTLPEAIVFTLIGLHLMSFAIGITGNVYIIFTSVGKVDGRTISAYFLAALAFSDILLVVWCVPFTVLANIISIHWILGDFMCSTVGYMQVACVVQRAFLLVASSLDRHRAIWRPLKRPKTMRGPVVVILLVFLLSFLVPIPIAYYSDLVPTAQHNESLHCIEVWPSAESEKIFAIFLLIFTYFLPLSVLMVTFGHMAKIIHHKPPGVVLNESLLTRRSASERKMIKVFLLEFVVYAICWMPIHVVTIFGISNSSIYDDVNIHIVWLFAQWIAMCNSAITPVVVILTKLDAERKISRRESELILDGSNPALKKRRLTQASWL